MLILNERYITDAEGNRTAVMIDIDAFQQLIAAWETLQDQYAYDVAKANLAKDEVIPLDQAITELEEQWTKDQAEH